MRELNRALWPRLSPLLDRALDLEPPARDQLIDAVRADDADLADALEQLLTEHERVLASGFLETLPFGPDAPPSMAGQTVGAYTLVRPLGMGGMGTVWLARRSDGRFEGHVAVKFVNLAVLDDVAQERFRREGTLLARLSHPHIARLFDAGVTSSGQPYLVLEYIEGARIDRHAAEQALGVEARLDLFLQAAEAVAHAHANLVVHRDLKPSNVLVDTQGRVKLLDFGIAALLDHESGSGPSTLTLDAGRVLTPEHAAPEQAAGGIVTTATDVYALGVLLYQLLTGRHPTAPDGEPTHAAILRALAEHEPRRLSEVIARFPPDSPDTRRLLDERSSTRDRLIRAYRGDLDTIVAKALKKDPAERYQTVTALGDDIRRHLRNEPVAARPDSVWYRTRKFAARRRLEIGAGAAIAAALLAGAGIAVSQAQRSARERDRALELLRRAEATNDFSGFLLTEATPRGKPISNLELLSRGEAVVGRRFARDPILHVHMLLTVAARYEENQQFDAWQRVLQRAYDASRTIDDPGLRAYAACAWAMTFTEKGESARAVAIITDAMPVLASNRDYVEYESGCRVLESVATRRGGDAPRAVVAAERALALEADRAGVPAREIDAASALANALTAAFRYADADAAFHRVAAMLDTQGLGDTRRMAVVLNNWSSMLQNSGQLVKGVEIGARAVATARATDSENGASTTMLATYGVALSSTGAHADAAAIFDEALVKARAAGSPTRLIAALSTAISAAANAGDGERATRLLTEANAALPAAKSAYSRGLVEAASARVALAADDRVRALEWARRAVSTLETATPSQTSLVATRPLLARTLNANGEHAEALRIAEQSLASAQGVRHPGQTHTANIGLALLEVAGARHGLGETAAARESIARALEHLNATFGPRAAVTHRAEQLRQQILVK